MKKILSRVALIFSLLLPVYFAVAALGVKFGWWDWKIGLGTLIVTWGPRLLIAHWFWRRLR
jgi:fatty-acyl-CoA synthase